MFAGVVRVRCQGIHTNALSPFQKRRSFVTAYKLSEGVYIIKVQGWIQIQILTDANLSHTNQTLSAHTLPRPAIPALRPADLAPAITSQRAYPAPTTPLPATRHLLPIYFNNQIRGSIRSSDFNDRWFSYPYPARPATFLLPTSYVLPKEAGSYSHKSPVCVCPTQSPVPSLAVSSCVIPLFDQVPFPNPHNFEPRDKHIGYYSPSPRPPKPTTTTRR